MSRADDGHEAHDGAAGSTDDAPERGPRFAWWQKAALATSIVVMVLGLVLRVVASPGETPPDRGTAATAEGGGTDDDAPRSGGSGLPPAAGLDATGLPWPAGTGGETASTGDGDGGGDEGDGSSAGEPDWTPMVFRLGFGFFAGFAMGFAVRAFVKLALIAAGIAIIGLFGLQFAGVVDVHWDAIAAHWDTVSAWLATQTASFAAFIRGYIPSAGLATLGFAAGFRRRR